MAYKSRPYKTNYGQSINWKFDYNALCNHVAVSKLALYVIVNINYILCNVRV